MKHNLFMLLCSANIFAISLSPPVVSVDVVKFSKSNDYITSLANISFADSTIVRSEVNGVVDKLVAESGDRVLKGQVILELRHGSESALLKQALAKFEYNKWLLKRKLNLFRGKVISDLELEEAKQNLIISQADLDVAKSNLDKKIIKAPFAGRLGVFGVKIGNYVTSNIDLIKLENDDVVWVDFFVPQVQAKLLKKGMKVYVFMGDSKKKKMLAEIYAIDPFLNNQRQLGVRAKLIDAGDQVVSGAYARVDVIVGEEKTVAILNETCIDVKNRKKVVYIVNDKDVVKAKEVKTGKMLGNGMVEVEGGLSESDRIVVLGGFKLKSGQKVIVSSNKKQ